MLYYTNTILSAEYVKIINIKKNSGLRVEKIQLSCVIQLVIHRSTKVKKKDDTFI